MGEKSSAKIDVREYLQSETLLFDGAMGTYLSQLSRAGLEKCELANLQQPQQVLQVHRAYLQAGAKALKTNTFAANPAALANDVALLQQVISAGWRLANQAALELPEAERPFIFADIGPFAAAAEVGLCLDVQVGLRPVVDCFLQLGAENFLFETFSDEAGLPELAAYIKRQCPQAFVVVSFAIQPDGYTRTGRAGAELLRTVQACPQIDAAGFNCVSGPYHLGKYLQEQQLQPADGQLLSIMPNAGYPTVINNRTFFGNNPEYFAEQLGRIAEMDVRLLGGCCGTTPEHIAAVAERLRPLKHNKAENKAGRFVAVGDVSVGDLDVAAQSLPNRFRSKAEAGEKLLAVELEPPQDVNLPQFMEKAKILQQAGVDIITVPDCPIGRARMDSSLLACKLHRELGVDVLPHMTCRDRNLNATKALLLGLSVEGVNSVLIVTGDPIPTAERDEIKSVFNFNSRILAKYISNLNETTLQTPFYICGALNVNARNFDVQLRLAEEKLQNGVQMLLTQPVLSKQGALNLRRAHQQLGAKILAGIMPPVSYRNACFMHNEISGITLDEELIESYRDKTPEEARALGVQVACQVVQGVAEFCDGFYMIPPFNKVDIICDILELLWQRR